MHMHRRHGISPDGPCVVCSDVGYAHAAALQNTLQAAHSEGFMVHPPPPPPPHHCGERWEWMY